MGADKRCFLSPVFGACDRSHAPQVVNLILSTGQPSKSPAKGQNVTSEEKKSELRRVRVCQVVRRGCRS